MKFFKNFSKKIRKSYLASAVALALVGLGGAVVHAEYYPARQAYDYNKPCVSTDADKYDRCGSLEGPVFNSFINTPSYGDERAFLDARRSDQAAAGSYKNVLPDVTQGSKEIIIRMYVHNNANQSTNDNPNKGPGEFDGIGVAKDTKVRIDLPEAVGSSLRARGYISASNATPQLVEDTVDFTSGESFKVEYIPGSATFVNNMAFKNGVALPDSVVTTGALIGDDALDGQLPGCFEYEGIVHIRVKVTPVKPAIEFSKQVGVVGKNGWAEKATVKPGEKLKWLIFFKNTGDPELTNVRISDKLPPHVTLVPGSVRYITASTNNQVADAPLFGTGGYNAQNWKKNGGFYIQFETVAKDDFQGCEVTIRNIAYNETDQSAKIEDVADATIKKENCVPVKPVTKPTALPNTGAGEVIAIFAVTVAVAAGAHGIIVRRFNS